MLTDQIVNVNSVKVIDRNLVIYVDDQCLTFNLSLLSDVLKTASEESLNNFKLSPSGYGIHWPDLNEDISITALLRDRRHMV